MMSKLNQLWRPWFLAVVVAVGFAMVWGIVVGVGIGLLEQLLLPRSPSSPHRSVTVLEGGIPVIAISGPRHGVWSEVTYETLDGKPLSVDEQRHDVSMVSVWLHGPIRQRARYYRLSRDGRTMNFIVRGDSPRVWYLIHDGEPDGSAWFEGYDLQTKRRVGYIGRNGFQQEKPSPEDRFSIPSRKFHYGGVIDVENQDYSSFYRYGGVTVSSISDSPIILLARNQLLAVNIRRCTVHVVRESFTMVSVVDTPPLRIYSDGSIEQVVGSSQEVDSVAVADSRTVVHSGVCLIIRTDRDIRLLDLDGKELHRFVMPESLRNKEFTAYFLDKSKVLAQVDRWQRRPNVQRTEFTWFDNQGNIEKEESVELPLGLRSKGWEEATLSTPLPAIWIVGTVFIAPRDHVRSGKRATYASALVAVLSDTWHMLLFVNAVGLLCAWLCYRRQKRYAQAWTWIWVVTVFLFGLPGLVGYLTYRRWPPLVPCPSCNAPAPRDRETCHACGQPFPRPALEGTEVFA